MRMFWRFCIFGEPCGDWRPTRKEAVADAEDAGYAEYDEQYRQFFVVVPASIQARFEHEISKEELRAA